MMRSMMQVKLLETVFTISGVVSAALLVGIAVLVAAQIVARALGMMVPSADDLASYCMAGSVFMGLAYTYRSNGHISVDIVTRRLPFLLRRRLEVIAGLVMLALVGHLVWFSTKFVIVSFSIGDVSPGVLAIPLWIPQCTMVLGSGCLWLAIAERLFKRAPSDSDTEASVQAMPRVE